MSLADQLTDGQLDCCRVDLREKAGVLMSRIQVRDMLRGKDQHRFCQMLLRGYPDAVVDADHGLDTYERDYLFDIFAERIANVSHWPMFMDDKEFNEKFLEGIVSAMKAGLLDVVP